MAAKINQSLIIRQSKNYTLAKINLNRELPALLVTPTTSPPYPAIFFLHYYRGSKENIHFLANEIGKKGFLALAIDMEYHGERSQEGKDILSIDLQSDKEAFYRTIRNSLLAIHYLEQHPHVDRNSIYFLGVSLGALVGSVVCGQYKKFKGIALVVSGGNIEILTQKSMLDSMVNIRYFLLKEKMTASDLAQNWKDIDPLTWIPHLNHSPIFFFNASQDIIVPPECTWELYDHTSSPKNIFWYPTGHGLLFERNFGVPQKIMSIFKKVHSSSRDGKD